MSEDSGTVVTLKVRVTPEFREKIVETAKANSRSMNAEIVHRLEKTFLADEAINELNSLPTPKGFSISPSTTIDNPPSRLVANDPRERRRLAKLAAAKALEDLPAQELFQLIFKKFNSNGLALTVEEIKKGEDLQEQAKSNIDKKAP